jgi:hypothetical protein
MRWDPNSYPRGHPFCGAYSFTPADSRVAFFCKFRMRLGSASKDAAAPSAYSLPAFAAYDGGSGGGEEGRGQTGGANTSGRGKKKDAGKEAFSRTRQHTRSRAGGRVHREGVATRYRRGQGARGDGDSGCAPRGWPCRGTRTPCAASAAPWSAWSLRRVRFPRRIYRVGVGGRRAGGERLDGADAFPEGEIRRVREDVSARRRRARSGVCRTRAFDSHPPATRLARFSKVPSRAPRLAEACDDDCDF